MGYSKTFLLLGLVFAVVLFISSHVSARELLAEPAQNEETVKTDTVKEANNEHEHNHDHDEHHGGHYPPGHHEIGEKVETDSMGEDKHGGHHHEHHYDHHGGHHHGGHHGHD